VNIYEKALYWHVACRMTMQLNKLKIIFNFCDLMRNEEFQKAKFAPN